MGGPLSILLDTHALIWWWTDETRLSAVARDMIRDGDADVVVSAASAWEIATKHRSGRLPEFDVAGQTLAEMFKATAGRTRARMLDITLDHGLHAGGYAMDHRDPFDRLLAAQSELENIPLVTRDPAFAAFPCETRW